MGPLEVRIEEEIGYSLAGGTFGVRIDAVRAYGDSVGGLAIDVHLKDQVAFVWYVSVAREHWGRGVGKQMMVHAEQVARVHRCGVMRLHCSHGNERAERLYTGLGFRRLIDGDTTIMEKVLA